MIFIDKKFCTILVILSIFTIQCIELTIGEKPSSEHGKFLSNNLTQSIDDSEVVLTKNKFRC